MLSSVSVSMEAPVHGGEKAVTCAHTVIIGGADQMSGDDFTESNDKAGCEEKVGQTGHVGHIGQAAGYVGQEKAALNCAAGKRKMPRMYAAGGKLFNMFQIVAHHRIFSKKEYQLLLSSK